jgi:Sec63 Brl domain
MPTAKSSQELLKIINGVQVFDIKFGVRASDGEGVPAAPQGGEVYVLPRGTDECEIDITLRRVRGSSDSLYAPRIRRQKQPSFWLALASSDELLAIKRIGILRESTTTTLAFAFPQNSDSGDMAIYVICDSLLGVQQEKRFRLLM